MCVGLILNLFNEFIKFIYQLFINLFITNPPKEILIAKKVIFLQNANTVMLLFSALLTLCFFSANELSCQSDITLV